MSNASICGHLLWIAFRRYAYVMKLYGSLDNYIAAHRKRAGLSQEELAVLLGLGGRETVSFFESSQRSPDLRVLLALEIIFDEPLWSIFAGLSHDVRSAVRDRALSLLEGSGEKASDQNVDKISLLDRLAYTPWENIE